RPGPCRPASRLTPAPTRHGHRPPCCIDPPVDRTFAPSALHSLSSGPSARGRRLLSWPVLSPSPSCWSDPYVDRTLAPSALHCLPSGPSRACRLLLVPVLSPSPE